jgi:hypothetical protein
MEACTGWLFVAQAVAGAESGQLGASRCGRALSPLVRCGSQRWDSGSLT